MNDREPVPMTEIDIADDEALRFAMRVLSNRHPTDADRDAAMAMLCAIRTRMRKVYAGTKP